MSSRREKLRQLCFKPYNPEEARECKEARQRKVRQLYEEEIATRENNQPEETLMETTNETTKVEETAIRTDDITSLDNNPNP